MNLFTPIQEVPRVGKQYQKKLSKLGIKTVRDLLFHFPHRYEDFSNIIPIKEIKEGENVCIQGKIVKIENIMTWKRRLVITTAVIEDDSGKINATWFNQPYLTNTLKENDFVYLAGKITKSKNKSELYLSSPIHEKISNQEDPHTTHTGRIIPVYPTTEGVSSRWIRYILKPLLSQIKDEIKDLIPKQIKETVHLLPVNEALKEIHFPSSLELVEKAKKRFDFQELFLVQLYVLRERVKLKKEKAIPLPYNNLLKKFVESLPYKLTNSQKDCAWQIIKDLEKDYPMNRLLEGDVGSGKTVVATMAILNTALSDKQTALMAPTEILAKQHFATIKSLLDSKKWRKLNIGLLTSEDCKINNRKTTKKIFLKKISNGELDVAIGTHALIQKNVKFERLALVILDEQHRFGVKQRANLCEKKGSIPHLLSMTATPIPRTLAISVYGDLDLSLLTEMPKGRKKIITQIVSPEKRGGVYRLIESEIEKGRQAFILCPRIEAKDTNKRWSGAKAVKEEYDELSKKIFPNLKIATLHGKMNAEKKEKTMKKFRENKINILITTSVIEVGIDISNATVMVIEGAERFGLAQLHQFRGRIGRGKEASYCFLFTESSESESLERLKALVNSESGFELAEKDLEIRGAGSVFGIKQSGIPDSITKSLTNPSLVEKTRDWAKRIIKHSPDLKKYPLLKERVEHMEKITHLE